MQPGCPGIPVESACRNNLSPQTPMRTPVVNGRSSSSVPAILHLDFRCVGIPGSNIPKWAPVFADAIEHIGDMHYLVSRNGEVFNLEVSLQPSAGTVDYLREMPNGKRGGAYICVTPRPVGGSTITMTVPIGPNTIESDVAKVLEQELADLIQLAQF
jgi:hypothetical protein